MIERCQAAFLQAAALAAGFGDQCDSHLRHYPFHRRTGFWRSAADGQSVVRGFLIAFPSLRYLPGALVGGRYWAGALILKPAFRDQRRVFPK